MSDAVTKDDLIGRIREAVGSNRRIMLNQLNAVLPVDLDPEVLDAVFLGLDEHGIMVVDEVTAKEAPASMRVQLLQLDADEEPPPVLKDPAEEELATNIRWYIREIGKVDRLSESEEASLGKLALEGDEKAADQLVEANLRLVVHTARRYSRSGVNLMDLIQAGNEGLMDAAKRYDPAKGVRFASFARWWIRQTIVKFIASTWHMIRVPKNLSKECHRLVVVRDAFKQRTGHAPTVAQLVAETGFSREHVELLESLALAPVSLDAPLPGKDGQVLESVLIDDHAPEPQQLSSAAALRTLLSQILSKLDVVDRRVTGLRFGLEGEAARSVEEVARLTGMTPEQVRQVERRALRRLKLLGKEHDLEEQLGEGVRRGASTRVDCSTEGSPLRARR